MAVSQAVDDNHINKGASDPLETNIYIISRNPEVFARLSEMTR